MSEVLTEERLEAWKETHEFRVYQAQDLNGRLDWRLYAAVEGARYRGVTIGNWFYPPGLEPGSTGFVTEAEARAYCKARGITLRN